MDLIHLEEVTARTPYHGRDVLRETTRAKAGAFSSTESRSTTQDQCLFAIALT